ncbi:uncharacterized protein LOC132984731 [Labrus mixtus]|uniref:uncharacterized protein LOC132984731 n=1 Tax=Labrus mixtus TaxID=508554 RepID=UPI0029BFF168|nr:uncharacterized protein LOC132984731 [Labrus mixtus]
MSTGRNQHKRCCVVGCKDPPVSLHRLPAAEDLREKWLDFIYDGDVPSSVGKHLCVCADHFTPDCFVNYGQYSSGMATKLLLEDGSVPTVRVRSNDEENVSQRYNEQRPRDAPPSLPLTNLAPQSLNMAGPQSELIISSLPFRNLPPQSMVNISGSQSEVIIASRPFRNLPPQSMMNISGAQSELIISSLPLSNLATQSLDISGTTNQESLLELGTVLLDAACQTDPQKGCSVGTQLTKTTLQARFRSKGTQSSVPRKDVGVTVGTSTLTKRPLKRTRLEECSPLTCDSADSAKDLSGSTDVTPEPSGPVNKTTFTICETYLLEIFKECPVCQAVCDVQQRRMGPFLYVDQQCQNCRFERKWSSKPDVGGAPAGNLQRSSAVSATIKTEEDSSTAREGGRVDLHPQPHP